MTEYTNTSGLGLLSLRHPYSSSVERLKLLTNRKANKHFGKKGKEQGNPREYCVENFRPGANKMDDFGRFL
jgi:hypothetical protein